MLATDVAARGLGVQHHKPTSSSSRMQLHPAQPAHLHPVLPHALLHVWLWHPALPPHQVCSSFRLLHLAVPSASLLRGTPLCSQRRGDRCGCQSSCRDQRKASLSALLAHVCSQTCLAGKARAARTDKSCRQQDSMAPLAGPAAMAGSSITTDTICWTQCSLWNISPVVGEEGQRGVQDFYLIGAEATRQWERDG